MTDEEMKGLELEETDDKHWSNFEDPFFGGLAREVCFRYKPEEMGSDVWEAQK